MDNGEHGNGHQHACTGATVRSKAIGVLASSALVLLAVNAYAQLGAIGGIASIQGKKQTTFPLFTLTAKTGRADILDAGFYLYYAQADRYMGKDIYTVFSGNPRERLVYKIFNVSYNLTSDMNLSLSIPYVSYDWGQIITGPTNLSGTFGIVRSGGGLSNPAVRFMYQFLSSPMLAVYGTVYLPTGFMQVGSEGTDLELDVAYTRDIGIVQWDSNVGYRLTGKLPSTDVKPNDIIIANTAFSIPFGLSLSGFFELNLMDAGQLTDLGIDYTVQQLKIDLVPGIRLSVMPNLFLTMALKYSAYNTFQLGYHYIYTLGLDYLVL
ncbi:MAG: transporter [Deltaproteobacteria bacterium]|nr:transporter [Deltaproteobacteria bacterium]MCL5277550.1 transporter [Deltaproteobacteria bacterium]